MSKTKLLSGLLAVIVSAFIVITAKAQVQSCPENINFSNGTLTHWSAYTGNFTNSSGSKSVKTYDTASAAPTGTIGAVSINESGYSVYGIQVSASNAVDPFGGFPTIPTINGFHYSNSVILGSTTVAPGSNRGLIRGISYTITVPAGNSGTPYTMTYAYAMVLENGSHASNQQPLAKATLTYQDSVFECASPSYFLPTSGAGNVLDAAAAAQQGFKLSPVASPNSIQQENPYRVWTKSWTEVTFDLSAFRGKQVVLTFEADNCIPGGHFSYAYFAIRNDCNGLTISGPSSACSNGIVTYSVPALANANYLWTWPAGWTKIVDSANILKLMPGAQSGTITAQETNSCANLQASLDVSTTLPTIPGKLSGNNSVCTKNNSSTISLSGNRGSVLNWLSTTDGTNWTIIPETDTFLVASNLTTTTSYKAVIQNGASCAIDSSNIAIIKVSPTTVGGSLSPASLTICKGQNKGAAITLTGNTGAVLNWQYSTDSVNWVNSNPFKTDSVFEINSVDTPTVFRAIVQSGVCPSDTSRLSLVNIENAYFPQAVLKPDSLALCFDQKGTLHADITIGTSYKWLTTNSLYDPNNGNIPYTPYTVSALVAPSRSSNYILSVQNAGCQNILLDTFHVKVFPPLIVSAGPDTSVVVDQPLQLFATASDTADLAYLWTPAYGLNNTTINNPISTLGPLLDSITYQVIATSSFGCTGSASKKITIYKTAPDIFVPSAFTPNNDGRNDVLKAIPVGIAKFNYLKIFNRWGQLLFNTIDAFRGWDGTANGVQQPSGTYVYITEGIDFLGKSVFRKGTIVLIR